MIYPADRSHASAEECFYPAPEKSGCSSSAILEFNDSRIIFIPTRKQLRLWFDQAVWEPVSWRKPSFGGDQRVAQRVNLAIHLGRIRNRAADLLA